MTRLSLVAVLAALLGACEGDPPGAADGGPNVCDDPVGGCAVCSAADCTTTAVAACRADPFVPAATFCASCHQDSRVRR